MPLPAFAPPLTALTTVATTLLLAWLLGRTALRRVAGLHAIERNTGGLLVGLVLQALLAFVLGLYGHLQAMPLVVLVVASLLGVAAWTRRNAVALPPSSPPAPELPRWIWLVLLLAFAPIVVAALQPPAIGDSGMYHLPLVQHFANTGHVHPTRDHLLPVFAILFHVLATVPYQVGGETAVQLLHLSCFASTGFVLLGAGHRMRVPHLGWLAACLWWGQPVFASNGTQALVDCVWPAFAAISVSFATLAWQPSDEGLAHDVASLDRTSPMLLAGLLGGAAGASKYIGFLVALPLGMIGLALTLRGQRTALLRGLVGALIGCGPFLWWNYAHSGDPLFPYVMSLEGGPYWNAEDLLAQRATWAQHGAGNHWYDVLLLPVRLVLQPREYLTGAPMSPLLLWLGLPFIGIAVLRSRAGSVLGLTALLGLTIWFGNSQQTRFLSGITVVLCWLAATGMHYSKLVSRKNQPWHAMMLGLVCLAVLLAFGCYRIYRAGLPPATSQQRDQQQRALHPTLDAHWWLADNHPNTKVYALLGDSVRHAATAGRALRYTGNWFGNGRFRDVWHSQQNQLRSGAEVARKCYTLGCEFLCIDLLQRPGMQLGELSPSELLAGSSRWRVVRCDVASLLLQRCNVSHKRRLQPLPSGQREFGAAAGSTWVVSLPSASSAIMMQFVALDQTVLHVVQHAGVHDGRAMLIGTAPANTDRVVLSAETSGDLLLHEVHYGN